MELFLDPGDHRSLALQLYDQLREAIADGRLPTGAR
jgi:GntR family transcriptional regulator/MocR family aminotransferase